MGTVGGVYTKSTMPEFSNAGAQTSGSDAPSGFVKMKVSTSLGFARSQPSITER